MDFKGFNTDSFEQFIHALSLKVFGNGVAIFGNGPDGGREATFNGEVNYPTDTSSRWNGYGVIQAKYKERLESRDKDFQWAQSQLKKELDEWKASEKRDPKPNYFIFCINVELTSASNGGKDKLNKLIDDYKTELGIKGYDLWDKDKLTSLIDCHSEVRQRFLSFFTPGDLLAAIAEKLKFESDITHTLLSYVRNELSAERDAKISQAGDRTGESPSLADVFIDLPSGSRELVSQHEDSEYQSLPDLLAASALNLDPLCLNFETIKPYASQYVFIGGPGSGKSTIGQFLAQIHRAAILERVNSTQNSAVKKQIKAIKDRCNSESLNWPSNPRYPFRIDLNHFASELALDIKNGGVDTLSKYLRKRISLDEDITHRQLLSWFENFRCLLIFDGLDEVPTSSNRSDVINCIQRFLGDIRDRLADVLIVASSRPDGYRNEFDEQGVQHKYLLPLNKEQSLKCADRYILTKYKTDKSKIQEQTDKVQSALGNPLVEKLMQSPLQITFMVTVLDAFGTVSESRWKLFDDYYRTIYTREKQKAVRPFDKVLNERSQEIDILHHNIGFVLQCRAEREQTNAELPIFEFTNMVRNLLYSSGLEENELESELKEISGAANERLVFLTSKRQDWLSFDVRSLQEYMAAMAITNGSPEVVIRRMEDIALSDYWRNTLLFAIGRFFNDPQFYYERNRIRVLCDDLNKGESKDIQYSKPGSILALEILESGTLGNTPTFNKSLTAIALELLEFQPNELNIPQRLAHIYDEKLADVFKESLSLRLGQKEAFNTLSSWILWEHLTSKGVTYLNELKIKNWPDSIQFNKNFYEFLLFSGDGIRKHEKDLVIIYLMNDPIILSQTERLTLQHVHYEEPSLIHDLFTILNGPFKEIKTEHHNLFDNTGIEPSLISGFEISDSLVNQSIINLMEETFKNGKLHKRWNIILNIFNFIENKSPESFNAIACDIAKDNEFYASSFFTHVIPWTFKKFINKVGISNLSQKTDNQTIKIDINDYLMDCFELEKSWSNPNKIESKSIENFQESLLSYTSISSISTSVSYNKINDLLKKFSDKDISTYMNNMFILSYIANSDRSTKHDSELIYKYFKKSDQKYKIVIFPTLPNGLINNNLDRDLWSKIYSILSKHIEQEKLTQHGLRFNNFYGEDNLKKVLTLDYHNHPEILKVAAFIISAGEVDNSNILLSNDIVKLASSPVEKAILSGFIDAKSSEALSDLQKSKNNISKSEKWIILSFLRDNKADIEAKIKQISIFIDLLNAEDWEIKGMAQKIHIEYVKSRPGSLTAESLNNRLTH